jgi:hypothetical protein
MLFNGNGHAMLAVSLGSLMRKEMLLLHGCGGQIHAGAGTKSA